MLDTNLSGVHILLSVHILFPERHVFGTVGAVVIWSAALQRSCAHVTAACTVHKCVRQHHVSVFAVDIRTACNESSKALGRPLQARWVAVGPGVRVQKRLPTVSRNHRQHL